MFAFKKLLTPFVIPPGIFVVVLVAWGAFRWIVRKRKDGLGVVFLGLALWAASSGPVADFLMARLESQWAMPREVAGDVIVLLGGGVLDGVPDLSGRGVPSGEMYPRIVTAVRLQRKLDLPVIVSGGRLREEDAPEALIVKRFLVDLGVAESRVIMEERSRDTFENAAFTKAICDRMGFTRPILLTSAYHMGRSVAAFEKAGLKVTPYPTNFYSLGHPPHTFWSWLPSAYSLGITSAAVHERLGVWAYRVFY